MYSFIKLILQLLLSLLLLSVCRSSRMNQQQHHVLKFAISRHQELSVYIWYSLQVTFTMLQLWNLSPFVGKKWNTITITGPRVTEITGCSDISMAKAHALLSSHKTEIISAGLIFLYLHNISVVQQCGWPLIIDTALCFILIIKGNSCPVSALHLAWLNDWHSPG